MKRLFFLFSAVLLIQFARGQGFNKAEYFFDTDPGINNGTQITLTGTSDTINFSAAISTASLSSGFHFLGLRVRHNNGTWSLFEKRGFYISSSTSDAANITAAEYFFDADPGPGNGTATSVGTTGAVVNFTAIIPTSLSAGFHFVAIRTKDANGVWGLFEKRGFYISSSTSDAANIVAAEFFFDTDPGVGNGISTSVGTTGSVVNFNATIPTTLPAGFHFLAIRVKGQDGVWGLFEKRGFYISNSTTDAANIVAAEYFFDTDPGVGNGTSTSVGATGSVVNFTATIPTSLSAGFHFLAIRVKGQDGIWGLYEKRGFYVSNASADAANIVAAEYFFDTDPGPGNGIAASVGTTGAVVNFTAVIPTSLPAGFHFLSIRVKGTDGVWGLFEKRGFYISTATADAPIITAAEYFFDADPGVGNGTPLTITTPGNIVTQTFNIPEPALTLGQHFLAIRVKDQSGKWGLYDFDTLNIGNSTITCPANATVNAGAGQCTAVVNSIDPVVTPPQSFTYTLTGATTGSGSGTASGQTFNAGVTTVQYVLTGSPTVNCSFTVTVNASVIPSVTIGASATNICTGTNVTFSATPTNGGATPSYQWKLNGINVGTNSTTYQNSTLANNDVVTVVMTSSIPCATPAGATSNSITMTVTSTATPSVIIGTSATTICSGTNVIFTATATGGGGAPGFQWKLNGVNVGANSATYQNSALVNGDQVAVVMTSSLTCVTQPTATSNTITMTVNPTVAPSVSIAASATSICSGTNVIFTATPTNGGATPSYQWRLNGGNVGTNSATYQNATLANNDVVTVVMTSSLACSVPAAATSNAITMSVTTTVTPSVSIAATATTICSGTNVTFTASPTNGGTPSYQWTLNGGNVGTNSATYQNAALANNDVVTVVMTSSLTCVTQPTATSNAITITVSGTVAPSVSIGASATTICSGTNVIFTATPTNGGATPSYQWKLNGSNVGINSATYQNATLANNDVVTVVMTSSLACAVPSTATSNAITITVTSPVTPSVSIAASATSICSGANVIFTATPTNGGAAPSYQWKLNGANVGTNSATYQNAALANNDVVTVVMTSSLTCVTQPTATSNAITMTVTAPVTPLVSISASATTICSGTNVTFTATPTNGGTPSYQWTLNGGNVGTNSATYQNAALANNDVITVVMTSSLTCVTQPTATSNAITITVSGTVAPSVSIGASATTICSGTNVIFTATPTNGGATPSYQWTLNGGNVGTNSATYQNATLANNDVVTVVMTSSLACAVPSTATSNVITITVTSQLTPSVSIAASATSICAGTNVTFTATPTNGGSPSYQWKLNGANVGTNSATYQNAALANNDVVTVVMTSSLTCVTQPTTTSNAITMTITAPVTPSVSISASATTICSGTNVTFNATPANGGTPSYQWMLNGTNVGTNSPTYQNAALVNNDVVTVVMATSLTCVTQSTATSNAITIAVNPTIVPSVSIAASATTICSGTNVTFTATPTNGGATPSYQWKLDGTNVGTNSPTYQNTALANNNMITVVMTSSAACPNPATATSNAITMTVTSPVTPTVSIAASGTTICSGTNVTFTATPTNGGTPSYQWKLNGNNVGTNSPIYQNTTLANNDVVTVVMTSSLTCVTQTTATSNAVTVTVAPAQTWIGVTSTDWNTASNWCGGIPSAATDVIIPSSAPNMPNLAGGTGTVRNIAINTGGSLTISATGTLDLFGNVVNNGTFATTAGNINFRGASSQSMPAFTANNVTMNGNGGMVPGGNISINGTLTLTNGNITLGANNLSLTGSSTGSLASHIITNSTGNVIVRSLAASNTRTIPVAVNATSYNPVVITANAGHTTDDVSVRVVQGVFINGSSGALFTDKVVDKTWIIDEGTAGGSNVNVTLQWTATQELTGFLRDKSYVTQNIAGTWQTSAATAAGGTDPFTQSKTNVTGFSPFSVQTTPVPKPTKGIYPNPVKTILNIVTELPLAQRGILSIYDAMGRLVMQQPVSIGAGLSQTSINVEKLSGGIYTIKFTGTEISKLLPTVQFMRQ